MVSGSEAGEKNKKDQPEKKKSLAEWNTKKPKNEKFLKPWDDSRKEFAAQKDTVWTQAWDTQSTFYGWPNNSPDGTDFNQEMLYAADTKTMTLRKREEYARSYAKQFKDLDKLVAPAYFGGDEKGAGRSGMIAPGQPAAVGADSKDNAFNLIMGPTMASGVTGNKASTGVAERYARSGSRARPPLLPTGWYRLTRF